MIVGIKYVFFIRVDYVVAVFVKARVNYARRAPRDSLTVVIYPRDVFGVAVSTRGTYVYLEVLPLKREWLSRKCFPQMLLDGFVLLELT